MSKPTIRTGLRYSVAIHTALLVMLFGGIKGCGHGKGDTDKSQPSAQGPSHPENQQIIDKEVEVELKEMTPEEIAKEDALRQKPEFKKRECGDRNWYGGIGVEIIPTRDGLMVEHVYKGYPADKAGVQDGDQLLNFDDYKGEPGTPVKIIYKRVGESDPRIIDSIREKICIRQGVLP